MEILRQVVDGYVTDRVSPEDLPMAAAEALARGLDSPRLRELAALTRADDVREIVDLLAEVLQELEIDVPHGDAVRWERVRSWAGDMVQGVVNAHEGASQITTEYFRLGEPEPLKEIYILTVSWDISADQRRALEKSMLEAAKDLLQKLPRAKP